eukprot:401771_1
MSDEAWQAAIRCPIKHINPKLHLQSNCNFFAFNGWDKKLVEYNPNTDKWVKWQIPCEILKKCHFTKDSSIHLSENRQTLYIFDNGKYIEMNLTENTIDKSKYRFQKTESTPLYSQSTVIGYENNGRRKYEFHVFAGYENNEHKKYNVALNKYETIHKFTQFEGIGSVGEDVVFFSVVKTDDKVILIGAWEKIDDYQKIVYKICCYNIKANEWNVTDLTLSDEEDTERTNANENEEYGSDYESGKSGKRLNVKEQ